MLKVNNKNGRTFGHISYLFLVFLLLTLNKQMLVGLYPLLHIATPLIIKKVSTKVAASRFSCKQLNILSQQ